MEQKDLNQHYQDKYAKLYLEKTLLAPYAVRKSKLLANMASKFGVHKVLDLGSNVHGSVKTEGSLRLQMNEKGIDYIGMDLSFRYFDKQFLRGQGVLEEKIYPQIYGIVGSIANLPIESDSMEMVVCADVLEHTADPAGALKEIYRVMKSKGTALIVLPSLYKLDIADFKHIEEKRKSSHLKKTIIDEWILICEKNGFLIDEKNSLSIGIASGLSYFAWMNEQFIPERKNLSDTETNLPNSILHKQAKNIFSKYAELLDSKIQTEGLDQVFLKALKQGDIKKVFQILNDISFTIISNQIEKDILHNFFSEVSSVQYLPERIETIKKIFKNSKFPRFLLGSSVLLVLKKKNN